MAWCVARQQVAALTQYSLNQLHRKTLARLTVSAGIRAAGRQADSETLDLNGIDDPLAATVR